MLRVCNVINHNSGCLGEMAFLMFCSLQFLCSKWRWGNSSVRSRAWRWRRCLNMWSQCFPPTIWRMHFRDGWTTTMPSTFKPAPLSRSSMSAMVEWSFPTWLHSLRNAATLSTRSMPRSMEGTDDQFIAGAYLNE